MIPNVETLEKFARALEIPLYRLFTDGKSTRMPKSLSANFEFAQEIEGGHRCDLRLLDNAFSRMGERRRNLLVGLARKMARRRVRGL